MRVMFMVLTGGLRTELDQFKHQIPDRNEPQKKPTLSPTPLLPHSSWSGNEQNFAVGGRLPPKRNEGRILPKFSNQVRCYLPRVEWGKGDRPGVRMTERLLWERNIRR